MQDPLTFQEDNNFNNETEYVSNQHQEPLEDIGISSASDRSSKEFPDVLTTETIPQVPPKTESCCEFDKVLSSIEKRVFLPLIDSHRPLKDQQAPAITITEATKCYEKSGASFICYGILTELPNLGIHLEAKHRYSEFEALRKLLSKVHPYCIVPPIPEKHSVADYASKPGKAKENPNIIDKRKKLLQSFLNKIASHSILSGEHVFHRFLTGDGSWFDILASSGLSYHLKKKDTVVSVSERTALKSPDPQFLASEDFTTRFLAQITFIRKIFKGIIKNYDESSTILSELGTNYNGWSLNEEKLSEAIDKTGEAIDTTTEATQQLSITAQAQLGMFLKEYQQYSMAVEKVLRWRHKKHVEFETLSESLLGKQNHLEKLETSEHESQRLTAVLNSEGSSGYVPPAGSSRPNGLMGAINSLIDNDPESTRRKTISKTKDKITTIEEQRESSRQQLIKSNEKIQLDLNEFQKQKIYDLRNSLLGYAISQRDYHLKSMNAWKEAKMFVCKVKEVLLGHELIMHSWMKFIVWASVVLSTVIIDLDIDPMNDLSSSFGPEIPLSGLYGTIYHFSNASDGCKYPLNGNLSSNAIVLVQRGGCSFYRKVQLMQTYNAKAVIVGNNRNRQNLIRMFSSDSNSKIFIPSVFISQNDYEILTNLANVNVLITRNRNDTLMFYILLIGFCSPLLIFALIYGFWICHERFLGVLKISKCELVLSKMSIIAKSDANECICTICLENVQIGSEMRDLSCMHEFHKECIDEWFHYKLECPNCKYRI